MKKFFLFAVALVGTLLAHAQLSDGVSATLQAGETTTVFYGFNAFKDAVDAAPTEGGIITLSPGSFGNPGIISKSMKIYGAGFWMDEATNVSETRVNGHFEIVSTDDLSPVVRVEGIYFVNDVKVSGTQKIENTEIVKCSFNSFFNYIDTHNTIIRQCYLRYDLTGDGKFKATALVVANSIFRYASRNYAAGSQISIDHCIMTGNDGHNGPYFYTNNIINHPYYAIDAGATCYNNVGYGGILSNGDNNVCQGNYDSSMWKKWSDLFADGGDNLSFTKDDKLRTWELADPTTYVGTDGTPCGVTGGEFPWNPIPATPRIISTSVDAKSEAGKLKVTIKAEARPIE